MKTRKIATLFLAAALTIGFTMPMSAHAKPPRDQAEWMETLTPDQKASAKKIMEASGPHMKSLRQELDAKRAELDSLRKSKDPDVRAIEKLSGEIGAIRGKMLVCRVETKAKLRAAGLPVDQMRKDVPDEMNEKAPRRRPPRLNEQLTAEQKATAQKIIDEHMKDIEGARNQLATRQAALAEAMTSASPDAAKIEQLSREIGEIRGQIFAKRVELRKKFADAGLPENTLAKKPGKPGRDGRPHMERAVGRDHRDGGKRPEMKDRAPRGEAPAGAPANTAGN